MVHEKAADTDVLIVGAGPVGLALTGDLGRRGQRCILVEQGDGSILQPKMDLVGIRTMEFCRRWGIVGDVEQSPYPRDYPQDNVYLTSLNGYELGRETFPAMGQQRSPSQSPQRRERCPQNMFDPILRRFAESSPATSIRYHSRLLSFEQDARGISATIQSAVTGEQHSIDAAYIVGCDGARSIVRETLNIRMLGNSALTYTTNVIFRCADLNHLHDKAPGYRYIFIDEEGTWATIVAINGRDQWRMSIVGGSEPRIYSTAEISHAIGRAVGRDFDFEILTVVPWTRAELVAEHFSRERAFIAGDAAHVMSPTGGFGMNTGIADAVDLSWKLAAVLDGWAPPSLLESYEMERRPVAANNIREASANLRRMLSPGHNPGLLADTSQGAATRLRVGREFSEAMRREWYTLNIHLGFVYSQSPICAHELGDSRAPGPYDIYEQTTEPGARAPHVWLADGRSSLDLFGKGFVLLSRSSDIDLSAFEHAAREGNIPFQGIVIDEDAFRSAYEKNLTLVRPDGHVAWRADVMPDNPKEILRLVTGHFAGRRNAKHTTASGE